MAHAELGDGGLKRCGSPTTLDRFRKSCIGRSDDALSWRVPPALLCYVPSFRLINVQTSSTKRIRSTDNTHKRKCPVSDWLRLFECTNM
jgi:hypothetical protein